MFRGKLPRFRRQKFEKLTPQTRNFGCKKFQRSFKGSARPHDDERRFRLRSCVMQNVARARSANFARKIAAFSIPNI